VFVFEDLKVKNMTKRPAPRVSGSGMSLPNGAKAKAGLNRAILASAWGTVKTYTEYKAARAGKLVIAVPPHHTSQECSKCSHTRPDSRVTTRLFVCGNCGSTADAHENAAAVIKNRGISMLMDGTIAVRESKRTMRLRKKEQLGTGRAEVTRGEKTVRRIAEHREALVSENRETPTTTEVVTV
jgi:putative transposase